MARDDGSLPITVEEYLTSWLESRRSDMRPSAWISYETSMRRYVLGHIGSLTLEELDGPTLTRLYLTLAETGSAVGGPLAAATVRYVHDVLRNALGEAARTGAVPTNAAADAELPPGGDGRRPAVLTAGEVHTLLEAVSRHPHRWLWHVAVGTGMRRSELLALTWADVESAAVRVERARVIANGEALVSPVRGRQRRTIHLDDRTLAAFAGQRDEQAETRRSAAAGWDDASELVFTNSTGGPLNAKDVSRVFTTIVRVLPIPAIRLHDLRHTHAAFLLEAGVPVRLVSQRLGHHSTTMTSSSYAHLRSALDTDVARRFGEHLWGAE